MRLQKFIILLFFCPFIKIYYQIRVLIIDIVIFSNYFILSIFFIGEGAKDKEFVTNEFKKNLNTGNIGFNSIKEGIKIQPYFKNRVGFSDFGIKKGKIIEHQGYLRIQVDNLRFNLTGIINRILF